MYIVPVRVGPILDNDKLEFGEAPQRYPIRTSDKSKQLFLLCFAEFTNNLPKVAKVSECTCGNGNSNCFLIGKNNINVNDLHDDRVVCSEAIIASTLLQSINVPLLK